jgi:hypothetical protein
MVTSQDCLKKYGMPSPGAKYLVLFVPPTTVPSTAIPRRIYCSKDLVIPLQKAITNLVNRGFIEELKTWDGCFNVRQQRGGSSWSLHSWGIAVDVNAQWNRMGAAPTLSDGFVQCFTDAGFDWGGTWKRPDGMHFQLSKI